MFGVLLGLSCWVTSDRCLFYFRIVITFEIVTNVLTTGHTSSPEITSIFFMLSIPFVIHTYV
jgi:glucan phosphoethanolaminetransferase (alkaline phosphatase superfamily)